MTNDNNTPKTASHMLFHELAANGGTKRDTRDIVDRLNIFTANNRDWPTIADAAAEIIRLRARVDELENVCGDSADRMVELRTERDEARMEVCTLSGNGSCDSTEREAESRGWQYLFAEENPTYVCDHCGETVDSNNAFHYAELPRDIASANKGESATLCRKCEEMIEADANNEYFKTNHR